MKATASRRLVAVLDNEALQAIANLAHPKHRSMIALVSAASQRNSRRSGEARLLTTTAVRVEAGISRRQPAAALLGQLRIADVVLDSPRANECADLLRRAGATAVDVTVAQAALAERDQGETVTVYTADVGDMQKLISAGGGGIRVRLA